MKKWLVVNKGADFKKIGQQFHIDPVTARIIRNREIKEEDAIRKYLYGTLEELYDPYLLKDVVLLTDILQKKIEDGRTIRIIGDYDIDGVMSTYILRQGIESCGGEVSTQIPDRMKDGYGINENLIQRAYDDGMDTIITCDNGISAIPEIAYAKSLGLTVLVTDHHEIPFTEEEGEKKYLRSEADAIVNPKQPDCAYPFRELCGAAVAWKVMQVLYEKMGKKRSDADCFLENVAFATVGDVMNLTDENRILVREGLKRLRQTKNPGMRALIAQNKLEPSKVGSYHIGFVLGPCINASGRLDTAKRSLELFLQRDEVRAAQMAEELVELNTQRKDMTTEGVETARRAVEESFSGDKVLVLYLEEVHESLAGIIAGRIREQYHRPVFVLTNAEDGVKGSGRSIEEYSMYEELCKCSELFTKFGGHPMAAGLSLPRENVEPFRRKINECCTLTEEDFVAKVRIDVPMPVSYVTTELVREFECLEPFGKGNEKPVFADRELSLQRAWIVGKNRNVLKLNLSTKDGRKVSAVYFGNIEDFIRYFVLKYGEQSWEKALAGKENDICMSIIYYPDINSYQGTESIQIVIRNYR